MKSYTLLLLLLTLVLADQVIPQPDTSNQDFPIEFKGTVKPHETHVFTSDCFTMNKITLHADKKGGQIVLDAQAPSSFFCADVYLFVAGSQWFLHSCEMRGVHKWNIKKWENSTVDAYQDVLQYGLAIFRIDINIWKDIVFLWDVYKAFMKEDTKYLRSFLEKHMQFKYKTREERFVDVPEHLIHTGDAISILKMNREEVGICYGSGSRAGHSAVFIRDPFTQKLYVAETTPGLGVHKYEYAVWLDLHTNGTLCTGETCSAVWLPVNRKYTKHIDEEKVWQWFSEREGFEYCYHGNFFSVLDNKEFPLPYPMNSTYFGLLLGYLLERSSPDSAKDLLYRAFEQRIPIKVNTFEDVVTYARDNNMGVMDLYVIPEQDDWRYPIKTSRPKPGQLTVDTRECLQCTGLVVKLWKVSGMLDAVFGEGISDKIQSAEFHPRDLYQIKIYEPLKPAVCQTDNEEFCQILGTHLMMLEGANSVDVRAHMNEKCGLVWPEFPRTPEVC
ncbi:hypothetical protein P9112_008041 [Eukaryota sp. TZLM1-RC]